MERLRTHLLVLLTVAVCAPALGQEQDATVRIGVLVKRGTERCLEKWGPTAEYLTSQIPGYTFTIVLLDFDEVNPTVERGEVDFILTNPAFYVGLEKLYGANRIATFKNRRAAGVYTIFGGVIFRRADRDDIQDLDDLKGKTFMAVEETSFGGWQVAWRELKERGIDPHHDFSGLTFGGTHDAVVYAVRDGKVDAGTVRTDTLERMAAEGRIRLEDFHALRHDHIGEDVCEFPFLHSTDMYPEWPMAKLAHTSNELAEKVAVALIGMPADGPAAQAARCAGWTVPLNYQPVHDCLKELRVGPYKDYGKITLGDVLRQYWPWIVSAIVLLAAMAVMLACVLRLLRQRKRADETLRDSERKYRVLLENLPQRIFSKDRDLIYVSCNENFARALKIKPEQFARKTDYDFFPAELADKYREDDKRVMESGKTEEIEEKYIQDGQQAIVHTVKTPIKDENGNSIGVLGIFWDITERKKMEAAAAAHTVELEQRTVELEKSRRVAMGMMEDAEQARKLAEAAREELRESEERLQAILDTIQAGVVVIVEESHTIVGANPAALAMIGASREEVVGRVCHNYICPAEMGRCPVTDLGQEVDNSEQVLIKADGQSIPVLKTVTRVMLNGRRHLLDSFVDISELKRTEERLRESEERHRTITETAQDAVITADAEGHIRFWNPAAEKIFGFSAAEAVGKNMMDIIVPPQYHEAKRKALAEFGRTGHGAVIGKTLELTALRKDGGEFPIEISLSGYKGTDGFTAVAVLRDITERSCAKVELQRMHAESRQLLESIPLLLIALDANDRVTSWNSSAERAFGILTTDAVGQLLADLEIEWDHGTVARAITECRAKNRLTRVDELRFKPTGGTGGFLSIAANPLSTDRGECADVLLVAADITEQRILEGQLVQAQKLESIGQLAAGIAHEINTPIQYVGDNVRFLSDSMDDLLGLISSYRDLVAVVAKDAGTEDPVSKAATLERDADLPYIEEELPKSIAQSLDGVARVSKIVRAMKDFSHPDGEGMETVDLNKAIESTVTVARNEWKYVAEVVTEFDPALPPVPCLVGDFNQVILNIVINAAHAIADVVGDGAGGKGTITVSTRCDGDCAEVRIRDTGAGIPEEYHSKVFNPFFTTKEVGKGTGQGLSIAHAVITEKHGGTINFETEKDKGTTFVIRLPIENEAATVEETP